MAVLDATPATLTAVQDRAGALDVIVLGPGSYAGSSFNRREGLRYEAADNAIGRTVSGTAGHLGEGMAVRITGPMNLSRPGIQIAGCFHDTRDYTGINAGVITGDDVALRDWSAMHRPRSGARQIGYTIGSGSVRVRGFIYERFRHHQVGQVGQALDHAIYLKHCEGFVIRDGLLIDAGMFPLHLYTNADDGLMERLVVWDSVRGITFSGASDSSTGTSTYGTSDRNLLTRSILGKGRSGYLVETWVSDRSRPVSGNIVRENVITRAGGGAGTVQPGMVGVSLMANIDVDPRFTDPDGGDFRLRADSPALGYGPLMIQPEWATPAPPPGGGDPDPPPPPDDPCRAIKDELSAKETDLAAALIGRGVAESDRDAARAERDQALASLAVVVAARDEARDSLAEALADLAAVEDDLRKIRGSAGSPAGKAADRLRGIKGRSQKALDRLGD